MKKLVQAAPLWALLSTAACAASFTPVAVSGYNYDGIVEHTAVPPYSSAAQSLDGPSNNDALFEIGLPSATAGGLPQGGLFNFTTNGNTYSFQLGPYGNNNLLRANPSGALTLTTPAKFTIMAVLGFATQNNFGAGSTELVGDATLHFSDGSSTVYGRAIDLSDWQAASPLNPNVVTAAEGGMVNIAAGTAAAAFEATPGFPKLYVSLVTLTVGDAAKNVTSVTIGLFHCSV